MSEKPPKIDRAFIAVLVRGAEKTFDNAEKLFLEAEILAKANATARAVCLHQISLEECSKIENLGAWTASLLSGHPTDRKRVLAAFKRHSAKNRTNAYMLEGSEAEKDARGRGDWKAALDEFKRFQSEFHDKSNETKNASLYVDWNDGEFVSPTEQITSEMLAEIIERNRTFLGYAYNGLKMLKRSEKNPEAMQGIVMDFIKMAEQLRAENPNDPAVAMNEFIDRFLDAGRRKLESLR